MAPDTDLPGGRRLGEMLHERLEVRLSGYTAPSDTSDLLAVADAAVAAMGELLPLQYEVLELADFDQASPNFGHRALALLLAEGAVSNLLLWNWDDCVERSALEGERLQVARTLEDVQQLEVPSVAKIHGCVTRAETLLITSEQLDAPPFWTDATFASELRSSTAVFIGVGDVADYAKRRITQLTTDIPEIDVYLVSRGIVAGWGESVWSCLLPTLGEERRVAKTADEFLDELARAWALDLVDSVRGLSRALTSERAGGVARVLNALSEMCGPEVIAWLRSAAFRHRVGQSIVHTAEAQQAVVAIGVITGDAEAEVHFYTDARCQIAQSYYEILILGEAVRTTAVRREARRRAEQLAGRGLITGEATFLVSGTVIGPLDQVATVDVAEGEVEPSDVFAGPGGIDVLFVSAADVVSRSA